MAVKFRDYYETLGVAREASQDDIRKAFRKLARKYHPDVAEDKATAEARFKEINEAYEVLGEPEKRRKYDELGASWQQGQDFQPPPGWSQAGGGRGFEREFHFGGTGFSDFFEHFFGSGGGFESGSGGRRGPQSRPGRDVEGDIMVTLEEIARGSTREVTLRDERGGPPTRYQVKIPPGIAEGKRIRLAGKGESGQGRGKSGDLYLRVRYARHPDFRVEGTDLLHELPVAPWDAVLGAQAAVPTLSGRATVKIPPGTNNGARLRLRGMGLPIRDHAPGDLFVVIDVQIPGEISAAEKELWERLRTTSPFRAR